MVQVLAQRLERVRPALNLGLVAAVGVVIGVAPLMFQRAVSVDPAAAAALGYPAIFLCNVIGSLTLFLPVPGLAVVFAGGSVLHPVPVAVVAAAGMALGMVATYLLSTSAVALLQWLTNGRCTMATGLMNKVGNWLTKRGVVAAFLLAAVPNPFFDFSGLIAGAVRMPLWKFLLGTFVGKTVQALLVAVAGALVAGSLALS